jgi:tetratricopeptide (TPR) repeat protein
MADVDKPVVEEGGQEDVRDEAAPTTPTTEEAAAAPSSSEQQAGEQTEEGGATTFTYDKSLLIVGKGGRVKRPVRPDNTERDMQVQKLQEEIEKAKARIGEIKAALATTEDMLRLAPDHAALWREAGLMNQRLERIGAALGCLDRFLELVPEGEAAARVRGLAGELRQRLN